jgi:hypothetical protein
MKDRTYNYNPKESEELDALIEGSYVRFVQLERRNLLIISCILLFSLFAKVNPGKGTFFGLGFDKFQEDHYYITLITLLIYFLFAFVIYAFPQYKSALSKRGELSSNTGSITSGYEWWQVEWARLRLDVKYWVWLCFHYYLPVVIAVMTVILGVVKIV